MIEEAAADQGRFLLPNEDVGPGDISFSTENAPHILVLRANGDIEVRGKKIAQDQEVYEALKEIALCRIRTDP